MKKQPHYGQALNLDQLRFEELGRSPVSKVTDDRKDEAENQIAPHFILTTQRKGARDERELQSEQFRDHLT